MRTISKLFLLISLFLSACEENTEQVVDNSGTIIGYWVNQVRMDTLLRYERADMLRNNEYGFGFTPNHGFVERKASGECGTPPVPLDDFPGLWEKNDSILDIDAAYWGGIAHYQWKIVSLDKKYMTVAVIKEEYPH